MKLNAGQAFVWYPQQCHSIFLGEIGNCFSDLNVSAKHFRPDHVVLGRWTALARVIIN